MRLLFLGDVVGQAGRVAITERLPGLRERLRVDFVVVNGENATHGFGLTEKHAQQLLDAGADCITLGNHAFDQKEALVYVTRLRTVVRPLNFPKGTPGAGAALIEARNGAQVLVLNALGRVFMAEMDCPFRAIDAEITACPLKGGADVILVDFHAEATSEKQALGHFLDGRVSVVVGTHTHTPTADARVLPGGTAYQSDAGMCGDYNSVLGMDPQEPVHRFLMRLPKDRFAPAEGAATLAGLCVEIDDRTGLARSAHPLLIGGILPPVEPPGWGGS
jgi:metallophosphoesterase (TIGR00282 family)